MHPFEELVVACMLVEVVQVELDSDVGLRAKAPCAWPGRIESVGAEEVVLTEVDEQSTMF